MGSDPNVLCEFAESWPGQSIVQAVLARSAALSNQIAQQAVSQLPVGQKVQQPVGQIQESEKSQQVVGQTGQRTIPKIDELKTSDFEPDHVGIEQIEAERG